MCKCIIVKVGEAKKMNMNESRGKIYKFAKIGGNMQHVSLA